MLNLTPIFHLKPYKPYWINEDGDMIVNQKVKVKLSIGHYEDSILYDLVTWKHVLFC